MTENRAADGGAGGMDGGRDVGRLLGGRYRLLELLGEGGMATIYRAHDTQLGRDVAVKVLRPEYGTDPSFVARFKQEARAAASLSHPSVVSVYDYGTDQAGPFIVMELVDGRDLAEILHDRGALPINAAARIAEQVAGGLAAAHEHGMIHRDVKPGNILVRRDGRAQIGDFGIVRAFSESELTLPGTTLGSVHYFSPEQARGDAVTARSDLYSLGLVLFEMLTGRRAFEGDSAASVAMARLATDPPPPSSLRPEVPAALDAIVRRALARDPAQRFASAREFAQALRSFLDSRAVAPGPPLGAGGVAAASPPPGRSAAAGGMAAGAVLGEARGAAPVPAALEALEATQAGRARPAGSLRRDAYPPPRRAVTSRRELVVEEEGEGGASGWTWAAALLGLLILLAAGALVFVALSGGPGGSPGPSASSSATPTASPTPSGAALVTVPSIVGLPLPQAIGTLIRAGLEPGLRTDDFDPSVPKDSIISQSIPAGQQEIQGTEIDYVVSLGPEPTPSPTPSPVPTPTPTPVPTPTPTPVPTPTPTPVPTPTPPPSPTDTPAPTDTPPHGPP